MEWGSTVSTILWLLEIDVRSSLDEESAGFDTSTRGTELEWGADSCGTELSE